MQKYVTAGIYFVILLKQLLSSQGKIEDRDVLHKHQKKLNRQMNKGD
jgi:ribosomal protein S18